MAQEVYKANAVQMPVNMVGNDNEGTVFGAQVLPESVSPVAIFGQAPGAFLVIALFIAIMNAIGIKTRQKQLVENDGCSGNCAACAMSCDDRKEEAK